MPDVSGVVLAGGQSRRLGTNKAFVSVGGELLIERVLRPLAELSDDLIIVTNTPEDYRRFGVQLVGDVWPGMGSLGGIYSGLRAARHTRALVVGCDMPFLDLSLLRFMVLLSADYDVVIPRLDGLLEPLHAVYSQACLGPIEDLLRAQNLRIIDFLSRVRVRYVEQSEIEVLDPQRLSVFNVNTPEDLREAQRRVSRRGRRRLPNDQDL